MADRVLRLREGHVILQTYYAFDDAPMAAMGREEWLARFPTFMQVIRDVAHDRNVPLIDHLVRWSGSKSRITRFSSNACSTPST